MTVPRFRSPARLAPELAGQTLELHESAAHHATRVLRLAVGDALTLFDGTGGEYAATLVRADRRGAAVRIEGFRSADRESPLALTLAQGIAASDAMEYAIRKATELGATSIQPLVTARSAPLPSGERGERRVAHWRQIAIAACEQCGRNRVPDVLPPQPLTGWLGAWEGSGIVLAPEAERALAALAQPPAPIALLVGPEGGLDASEIRAASARGFHPVRLGPRVLRTETAAAAVLALAQAMWGDWR